jgi:peptidoglycan-N-acetylglucosamine deacetylase
MEIYSVFNGICARMVRAALIRSRTGRTVLTIGCVFLLGAPCVSIAEGVAKSEENRCWPAAALAGRPGERTIRRVPYDASIEPREGSLSLPPLPQSRRGSIRGVRLPHGEKLVALTFDLCENGNEISGYDSGIIDTLRQLNVKATFFASGKWLLDHPERAQQLLADPLFQVGNHSWTHRNYRLLSTEEVKADLDLGLKADAHMRGALRSKACFRPGAGKLSDLEHATLFRFPFGTCKPESLNAVNDAGLLAIQWDTVSGDPAPAQSAEAIRRGVVSHMKPGSISVMHANGRGWHTAEALPLIIADLRQKGFEFATVGELLEKGEPLIADSCYEVKPGDNARYDKLFPLERGAKAP